MFPDMIKSKLASSVLLLAALCPFVLPIAANADYEVYYEEGVRELPSSLPTPPTPPPAPPPPPPAPPPPMVQAPPPPPFSPPIVVPTDVSRLQTVNNSNTTVPPGLQPVSDGIVVLADNKFPSDDKPKANDKILAFAKDGAVMERLSPYAIKIVEGTVFVSVRRPSQLGMIKTPLGDIALSSNGELVIKIVNGKLHILNASATGTKCKIKLGSGAFAEYDKKTVAIRPGYEFVASKTKLTREDLRPSDGIARRRSKVFEDGRIALSEFSVDAFVRYSDLVAHLNQEESNVKERRIIADLSKMAAVLNYVNNSQGYSYTKPNTQLAGKDSSQPN